MADIRKHLDHNNNVICDVCGRKRKRSECQLAFGTGDIPVIMSCIDGCADQRHPLNTPPPLIFDGQPVPDARPDQGFNKETFITTVTPSGMSWGHLTHAGAWGLFNNPNTVFNFNGLWEWGFFLKS